MALALRILVGITGILLAFLGLRWMFAPYGIAAEQSITLGDVVALNTARGDLGGALVAAGVLCAIGLRTGQGLWLQAVAVIVGSIAVGRVVGMVSDGLAMSSLVPFAVEVVMVAVLLAAARTAAPGAAS
jgi:hypothetical protein